MIENLGEVLFLQLLGIVDERSPREYRKTVAKSSSTFFGPQIINTTSKSTVRLVAESVLQKCTVDDDALEVPEVYKDLSPLLASRSRLLPL